MVVSMCTVDIERDMQTDGMKKRDMQTDRMKE